MSEAPVDTLSQMLNRVALIRYSMKYTANTMFKVLFLDNKYLNISVLVLFITNATNAFQIPDQLIPNILTS